MNAFQRTRWRLLLLGTALFLSAGCGLSEYEQKMEETQKNQQFAENERKYLTSTPIRLPEPKNKDEKKTAEEVQALAYFSTLRAPNTIDINPKGGTVGPLYRYPGTATEFKDLLIGATKADRQRVLQALDLSPSAGKKSVPIKLPKGTVIQFDLYQGQSEKYTTRVYVYERNPYLIVVAFRMPPGTVSKLVDDKIDCSLRTLRP
jgi:hypothetical protein